VGHQTRIRVGDREVLTLADILPVDGPMRMLIVAKTPALVSVEAGHYFQGRQGRMFWNRLRDYDLLTAPPGTYEDDALLAHGYGVTDVVKAPRDYGDEPSDDEYRDGLARILGLVERLEPEVLMFVYKRVLDQILRFSFDRREKSKYGFNPELDEILGARVFVFPMPGTPCTASEASVAMSGLADLLAGGSPVHR
jgi:G:T/U-mismatch repair DNA glycosylase